jgi:hypothetical protein
LQRADEIGSHREGLDINSHRPIGADRHDDMRARSGQAAMQVSADTSNGWLAPVTRDEDHRGGRPSRVGGQDVAEHCPAEDESLAFDRA